MPICYLVRGYGAEMGKKQKRPDWKEQEDRSKKQAAKQAKKDPTLKKLWDRYDELVANLTEFALSQPQDSFLVKSARGDLGRQLDNLTSASLVGTSPYQKLCAACSPESYEAVNQELLTVEREFNKYSRLKFK